MPLLARACSKETGLGVRGWGRRGLGEAQERVIDNTTMGGRAVSGTRALSARYNYTRMSMAAMLAVIGRGRASAIGIGEIADTAARQFKLLARSTFVGVLGVGDINGPVNARKKQRGDQEHVNNTKHKN